MYTCARPGRSRGAQIAIRDAEVDNWIRKLPGERNLTIVSLLGRKNGPHGESEFKFYSFHGALDHESERRKRLSFQGWIDRRRFDRTIQVIEHPTYDGRMIPEEVLLAVSADIHGLLAEQACVVLVDSGGMQRTGRVCEFMDFVEDFASR